MRKPMALMLVLFVLLTAHVCGQEVFFDLTFDDEELGTWTEIAGVREFMYEAPTIVETPGKAGKSVLMTGNPTGHKDTFYYKLPEPVQDRLVVETWLLPTGGDRSIGLSVSNEHLYGDGDAVSVYLHNSGMIRYFANGGWHEVAPYTPGSWVRLKIVVDVEWQMYHIYVNDMNYSVATAPFRNTNRTEIDRVGFFMLGVGAQPDPVYVDSLVISR